MMEEFPGNSKNPTGPSAKQPLPEDKKIEKVVTGSVTRQHKSNGSKFKSIFFSSDFKSVVRFVAAGVLLPSLRDMFVNAVNRGTERMVYGEGGKRPPTQQNQQTQYGSRSIYTNPHNPIGRDPRDSQRGVPPYSRQPAHTSIGSRRDDFQFRMSSREDAENVLDRMYDIISQFHVISLSDLYELVGLEGTYVDNDWGWTFLDKVAIRQVREGYVIDLPQPEHLR